MSKVYRIIDFCSGDSFRPEFLPTSQLFESRKKPVDRDEKALDEARKYLNLRAELLWSRPNWVALQVNFPSRNYVPKAFLADTGIPGSCWCLGRWVTINKSLKRSRRESEKERDFIRLFHNRFRPVWTRRRVVWFFVSNIHFCWSTEVCWWKCVQYQSTLFSQLFYLLSKPFSPH